VCRADGSFDCAEEGLWGMTYGARRFRDGWLRLEAAGSPTGYFVEDHGADCRHCAAEGSPAFECGLCLLRHGRAQMEARCPTCLGYEGPDIEPGAPSEPCPITAPWYDDPLFGGGDAGDDVDGAETSDADAGVDVVDSIDAGFDADADGGREGGGSGGCSCLVAAGRAGGTSWIALLVAVAGIVPAGRRGRRRPAAPTLPNS